MSTQTPDNGKYQGWANRETWAFNMWVGSSQPLYKIARHFVGDTAVTPPEVLGLFAGFEHLARANQYDDLDSKNQAYLMAIDMSPDSTPNYAGFGNVNAYETAEALNEMFEPTD